MRPRDSIATLSMGDLLRSNEQYVIPIYQRNYAWGEKEISQLLQDIIDFVPKAGSEAKNYYLGTLIVFEREQRGEVVYETIDGQQRLTTLSLLISVLLNHEKLLQREDVDGPQLAFDCRPLSSHTLHAAHYGQFSPGQRYNTHIREAYELIKRLLRSKLAEHRVSGAEFVRFFLHHVKLLRSAVPPDTDLNHYFEIMNNRGEQLEKHEILKARLMDVFRDLPTMEKQRFDEAFHQIWEACSVMERYVQYGFSVEQRHALFGRQQWSSLVAASFDDVSQSVTGEMLSSGSSSSMTLSSILAGSGGPSEDGGSENESPDRFTAVTNFSNFLLHVLRIHTRKSSVRLDDKRLLEFFDNELRVVGDKVAFVKQFAFAMLKCRWLLDTYVIKREFLARTGTDRWSLKQLKWNSQNRGSYINTFGKENGFSENQQQTLLMLLSMFHVSTPTQVYKHWLNAALAYLYEQRTVHASAYAGYLEELARKFVFGRFLAHEPADYFALIYEDFAMEKLSWELLDLSKLTFGHIANNLIFNYVDYLLWKQTEEPGLRGFAFTFRSSVEHYYPQNPLQGIPKLDEEVLHSFGNLCLVSHSKNSRLSNLMPTAKREFYMQGEPDSLKQHRMMNDPRWSDWGVEAIREHEREMLQLLRRELYPSS